jgi:Domain of unknown function (DUF4184)
VPFTPFHMGPGCVVKALAGGSFSLAVFGFAQVAMDVEPLVRMLRGDAVIHGFSHTYLGATFVAIFSLLVGRPICQLLLNCWRPDGNSGFLNWLRGARVITWPAAITGAFIGTYSHVLLDSLMHSDMQPFSPFEEGNPTQGLVSFVAMHVVCAGAGVLGLVGLVVTYKLRANRSAGRTATSTED